MTMPSQPVARVLSAIKHATASGAGWMARCPAHDDRTPSLSIAEGRDGRAVLKCHAGCEPSAIVAAAGLSMRDLFDEAAHNGNLASKRVDAEYPYHDENGSHLFDVVRFDPKGFSQRAASGVWSMKDVRRVPYRLPQLLAGVNADRTAFIVEGEKDVDALATLGLVATTNPGGAGKWRPEYGEHFRAARVVVLPDNDNAGRDHARDVARQLLPVAKEVRVVELPDVPEKGDVSDWLSQGGTADALKALVRATPVLTEALVAGIVLATEATVVGDDGAPAHTIRPLREWRAYPALWEPPTALVQDILYPGVVTMIAAREKMGKTSLVAQMAAALSVGGWFLGSQVPRVKVLWYAMDEPLGAALVRFDGLKADGDLLVTRERPELASDFRRALMVHRPDVVVWDSLGDLWEGKVDSNSHDQTRAYLKPFIREARDINAAVVAIYHSNASGTKYAGAVAIGAVVDAPLMLKPRGVVTGEDGEDLPDDGRRLLEGRTRYGIVRIPLGFASGLYQRGEDAPPLTRRVLQVLADEPQSLNALTATLGARKSTVGDVVREHVSGSRVIRTGNHLTVTQAGLDFLAGTTGNHSGTDARGEAVPGKASSADAGNHFLHDGEEIV